MMDDELSSGALRFYLSALFIVKSIDLKFLTQSQVSVKCYDSWQKHMT